MRQPIVNDFVRLTENIPELSLHKGEVGVVRSTWFAPSATYEVEFTQIGNDYQTRCLLNVAQLVLEEDSLTNPDTNQPPADPRNDYFFPG